MSSYFIKHPTIAIIIAIVMTVLGILSLLGLPIAQYPDIAPPTIALTASYPGADAQTVVDSVASPIEQQMSGVSDMDYMSSVSANNGACTLNIIFRVGTNPNMDQNLAYMRYGQASAQLPQTVAQMGVTIKQSMGLPLLMYTLTSPDKTFDSIYLSNYGYVSLVDPLKRVPGVGDVQIFGAGRYAMRIWVDTTRMAQMGISVAEIKNAVAIQNAVNPSGQVGAEPAPAGQDFTYTIRTKGRLSTPEEFGNIIIRSDGDNFIYLKDVAKVELGAQSYGVLGRSNGSPCGAIAIYQSPGSNAVATVDAVKARLAEYEASYPAGMAGHVTLDTTLAVRESLNEIVKTLFEALGLVVVVVFLFLQGWRATLIPAIAVPVSILATFCFFPFIGFSLNTICLMGMVLAIGLVVDDAIVVVEAVESHMERGLTARQASFAAMEEVSGPVIAIALVLAAVFLPSLLLPGITGTLFQQFAVTIAISMLISAFNALTLSPALSALLLKPRHGQEKSKSPIQKFYNLFNRAYDSTASGYTRTCGFLARKLFITIPLLAVMAFLIVPVASKVPGGFLPDEDQGYMMVALQLPNASSMQRTSDAALKIEEYLLSLDEVATVTGVTGYNMLSGVQSTNNAFFFVGLTEWKDRTGPGQQVKSLLPRISAYLSTQVTEGIAFAFSPPAIAGVGTSGGVTMIVEDRQGKGVDYLAQQTNAFIAEAQKLPEVANIMTTNLPAVPQIRAELDEAQCLKQGVAISDANMLLQAFMGSLFVNYVSLYGQQWQVYIQAEGKDRTDIDKIKNFFMTNKHGDAVPLSTLIKTSTMVGPEFILRQNLYMGSQLMVTPHQGFSTEQTMRALEKLFDEFMPKDMGYEYSGMSFQEQKVQQGLGLVEIFGLSSLFVFLILAALYEKWTLPLTIFMTIPIAVLGAFIGLYLFGLELNLYAQIGLVMLIGLAAKNAILIVEFAVIEMERGVSLYDAMLSSSRLRLRPILMTSFAFILGCLPLAMATGSGAYARNSIGVLVIAGMLMATFIGCFFVPPCFYAIMRLFRIKIEKHHGGDDPDEVIAKKHLEESAF